MQQLFPYVLQNKIIDTSNSEKRWTDIQPMDTLGKFYRYKDGYIACIVNLNPPVESLVLFQTAATGKVVNIQPYYHGNYCNCWGNSFGFGKLKDYFYVRICGTGSAFGSSSLYIFSDLTTQSDEQGIFEYIWRGSLTMPDAYKFITLSSLNVENKKIHASYTAWKGFRGRRAYEKKTGHFDITYTLTNAAWVPDDSTKLDSHIINYF